MKTIRELNIKDWSGYFFEEMVNVLHIDPECFMVGNVKECTDGTMFYNIYYSDKTGVPHIAFNNIDCYFKENGDYSSLIFCDNNKNKNIIDIYFKIIEQLRDEVFSFIDEFEDHKFVSADDFTRFRFIKNNNVINDDEDDDDDDNDINPSRFKFRTDDNLLYNKKTNIPVCVISLSSVIKKENIHYPLSKLQKCFYENENFKKV